MDEEHGPSQVSWGARINIRERNDASDCPSWLKPADRDTWVQRGLIVWQEETQHIFRLLGTYALQLLDSLNEDDTWKERGIIVGEPVIRLTWGEHEESDEVLDNPIYLSPRQTRVLIRLLERNKATLEEIREQEERERDQVMKELARIFEDDIVRALRKIADRAQE